MVHSNVPARYSPAHCAELAFRLSSSTPVSCTRSDPSHSKTPGIGEFFHVPVFTLEYVISATSMSRRATT